MRYPQVCLLLALLAGGFAFGQIASSNTSEEWGAKTGPLTSAELATTFGRDCPGCETVISEICVGDDELCSDNCVQASQSSELDCSSKKEIIHWGVRHVCTPDPPENGKFCNDDTTIPCKTRYRCATGNPFPNASCNGPQCLQNETFVTYCAVCQRGVQDGHSTTKEHECLDCQTGSL
jgi:hypothetical protein